ncbi:MAG: DNA mismatch repair endonuclease MutL [Gammaproteobacteria bacterium]|nr:DNA mismatch repair endonuclease MutL [Gammaproteobacteria bacterium]
MANIIQLPPVLANQIAAGEVVERPASVVKELLENAIDAGARTVRIDVDRGGAALIRVRDDGVGIAPDELALALSRHATSKVRSFDDLMRVQTLGFRGEALPSIASVARVRLTSRQPRQDTAWSLEVEGTNITAESPRPASAPPGTTVEVRDLFFNTPARRRFLRTSRTEYLHVETVVRRTALAHPELDLVLTRDGRNALVARAAAEDAGLRRMSDICGARFAQTAIAFEAHAGAMHCFGWAAPAGEARASADLQYACVNGRVVRDPLLRHAMRAAFEEAVSEGRQPAYVVYLELPAGDLDVNVHPTKHEVRFGDARTVHDFVWSTVRRTLHGDQVDSEHPAAEPLRPELMRPELMPSGQEDPGADGGPGAYPGGDEELRALQSSRIEEGSSHQGGAGHSRSHSRQGAPWNHPQALRVADDELDKYVRLVGSATDQRPPTGDRKRAGPADSSLVRLSHRYALYRRDAERTWALVDGAALIQFVVERALKSGDEVSIPLLIPAAHSIPAPDLEANEAFSDHLGQLGFAVRRSAPEEVALLEIPACLQHLEQATLWDCLAASWGADIDVVTVALAQVAAQDMSSIDDTVMQRWLDCQAANTAWPPRVIRELNEAELTALFSRATVKDTAR